jgi:integrase
MKQLESITRLREVIRRQHKSLSTERTYCGWLVRYCRFLQTLPPVKQITASSEEKVEAFLSALARSDSAASTQNQAFNALVFFYQVALGQPLKNIDALRATRPQQIRHALPRADTLRLLNAVPDVGGYPTNLICRLLYGCGLNLRIKDVDLAGGKLMILAAKGGKDGVVKLPCAVAADLEQQMAYAKSVFERDQQVKLPLWLPHQLAKKYPEYQFAWPWAWLFPQRHPCTDPRNGRIVRYHLHEANVQRAVKIARRQLGLNITPHNLRHCYATHCVERGVNVKALQEAMRHKNAETTMGYVHAEALSVTSPLDQ